jgi:hypothetical protein
MELPHLTLYLRRLRAVVPGMRWREQLQTARVQFLVQVLLWACLAVAVKLCYVPVRDALQLDRPTVFYAAVVLTAFFPLLTAAYAMHQLCLPLAEGEHAASLPQPEWFIAPLGNAAALLGVLANVLLQILPGMVGLALIVLITGYAAGNDLPFETQIFLGQLTWQQFTMLPHYLLLAACLSLALRNTQSRSLWQPILAGAAALHLPAALDMGLQGNRATSEWYWYPFHPWQFWLGLGVVPFCGAVLLLLGWLLVSSTRRAATSPTALLALLGAVVGVLALFQYELLARASLVLPSLFIVDLWSVSTRYKELLARALWPSAPGTFLGGNLARQGYGMWHTIVPTAVDFYFWWSLAALVFWWRTALACLQAARRES